jgi:hypothetical protein
MRSSFYARRVYISKVSLLPLATFRSPIMRRLPNSEQEHRRPNDYCKYISLSYVDTS